MLSWVILFFCAGFLPFALGKAWSRKNAVSAAAAALLALLCTVAVYVLLSVLLGGAPGEAVLAFLPMILFALPLSFCAAFIGRRAARRAPGQATSAPKQADAFSNLKSGV